MSETFTMTLEEADALCKGYSDYIKGLYVNPYDEDNLKDFWDTGYKQAKRIDDASKGIF